MLYFILVARYNSSGTSSLQTIPQISSDIMKTQTWGEMLTSPKDIESTTSFSVKPPFWTSEEIFQPDLTDSTAPLFPFQLKRRNPMRKISSGYIYFIFFFIIVFNFPCSNFPLT